MRAIPIHQSAKNENQAPEHVELQQQFVFFYL